MQPEHRVDEQVSETEAQETISSFRFLVSFHCQMGWGAYQEMGYYVLPLSSGPAPLYPSYHVIFKVESYSFNSCKSDTIFSLLKYKSIINLTNVCS